MMSNETRWTPPPWRADLIGEEYTVEGMGNPSGTVAVVCSRRSVTGMADAHLIAAAPELYEALDMLMDASGPGDAEQILAEERENIMALLAKARGETS